MGQRESNEYLRDILRQKASGELSPAEAQVLVTAHLNDVHPQFNADLLTPAVGETRGDEAFDAMVTRPAPLMPAIDGHIWLPQLGAYKSLDCKVQVLPAAGKGTRKAVGLGEDPCYKGTKFLPNVARVWYLCAKTGELVFRSFVTGEDPIRDAIRFAKTEQASWGLDQSNWEDLAFIQFRLGELQGPGKVVVAKADNITISPQEELALECAYREFAPKKRRRGPGNRLAKTKISAIKAMVAANAECPAGTVASRGCIDHDGIEPLTASQLAKVVVYYVKHNGCVMARGTNDGSVRRIEEIPTHDLKDKDGNLLVSGHRLTALSLLADCHYGGGRYIWYELDGEKHIISHVELEEEEDEEIAELKQDFAEGLIPVDAMFRGIMSREHELVEEAGVKAWPRRENRGPVCAKDRTRTGDGNLQSGKAQMNSPKGATWDRRARAEGRFDRAAQKAYNQG